MIKQRMAGYASGNVQDAFSEWLKLNFVNQENAESNLKSLESDLRAEVLATIKELETTQQRYYLELQQLQEEKQVNQQYTVNMGDGLGIDEQVHSQTLHIFTYKPKDFFGIFLSSF